MFEQVMTGISHLTPEELEHARKYILLRQTTAEKQEQLEHKLFEKFRQLEPA